MAKEMQAPIARKDFQEWAGAVYRLYENIRLADGSSLSCTRHDLLPEVHALFVGSPENFHATMELCGLYDERLGEFRFINKELACLVDGLGDQELWNRSTQGENLLQLVMSYAENAIRQGYKTDLHTVEYDSLCQTVQTGLDAMTDYTGVLAARGEENAVLELRELALDIRAFWQDPLYAIYEKAGAKLERQYTEKFDQAVATAHKSGQAPVFGVEKARSILQTLSVHAEEEATENGNLYSVWRCSRLAKQLWDEYPSIKTRFRGSFTVDTSERYTKFGSIDSEHLKTANLRVSRKGLRGLTHERCSLPFPWRNSWNFLVFNLSYIQYTTKSLRNQLFPRKKLVFFGEYRYSAHNPDPDLAAASAPAGAPGSEPGHGDASGRETAAPA